MKLDELEAKARAATPGPWERRATHVFKSGERSANVCSISDPHASRFVEYAPVQHDSKGLDEAFANAAFISAANPTTVLKLIALLRGFAAVAKDAIRYDYGSDQPSMYVEPARELLAQLDADLEQP